MPAHTHDGIDWVARLADLRRADEANGPAQRAVAERLIAALPMSRPTVLDVGSGAGGMSAAIAGALAARSGGTLVVIDAVPELLAAAADAARSASGGAGAVEVVAIQADLATVTSQPTADATDTADTPGDQASAHHAAPGTHARLAADPTGLDAGRAGLGLDPGASGGDGGAVGAGDAVVNGGRPGLGVGGAGLGVDAGASGGDGGAVGASDAVVDGGRAGLGVGSGAFGGDRGAVGAGEAVGGGGRAVGAVGGGAGEGGSAVRVPAADLVWAANVAHHLPDQRRAVGALVGWLAPGGCLALAEGGLSMRCLPWDVGVGEPGLQDRLTAAHGIWFRGMRTGMPGAVRLPVGWNLVLADAGLADVGSFSYLVDVPAPLTDSGRAAVVSWLDWMGRATSELLDRDDLATIARLVDPDDIAYVGRRDDVFMLKASTVHLGWRR